MKMVTYFMEHIPSQRPILIVEDDAQTAKVMQRLVAARGFRVLSARSLAEARRQAAETEIGFLISDIGLPDGNGADLMRELHARFGIQGVAVTGYGMAADLERTKLAGFSMHLTKPIHVHDLEKVLALAEAELTKPPRGPGPTTGQ